MNDVQPLYVLAACLFCGILAGIPYELGCAVRACTRAKWAAAVADVLFFAAFGCLFAAVAALFRLPDFRLYMAAAALAGLALYCASLHRIVVLS